MRAIQRVLFHLPLVAILAIITSACISRDATSTPTTTSVAAQPMPTSSPTATATATATATPTTLPTAVTPPPPPPICDEQRVEALFHTFVDEFNQGDQAGLRQVFPAEAYEFAPSPPGPGMDQHLFRGYSDTGFSTGDLEELFNHVAARHAAGERLAVRDLVVSPIGQDPLWNTPELAWTGFQLDRVTGEGATRAVVGKGAVNCVDETILFAFMGDTPNGAVGDNSLLTGRPLPPTPTPNPSIPLELLRPLALPVLALGDACPNDTPRIVHPAFGAAAGDGPVFAIIAPRRDDPSQPDRIDDGPVELGEPLYVGWYGMKAIWIAASEHDGTVLVRGRRIDGLGVVHFQESVPPDQLLLRTSSGGSAVDAPGWHLRGGGLRVPGPGCYALQIDGPDFSKVIVFETVAGQ